MKDNFLDKLYLISNKTLETLNKVKIPEGLVLQEYLTSLQSPENVERKNFLLDMLNIIDSLEVSMKKKERHLHVAVARLMEALNLFYEKR